MRGLHLLFCPAPGGHQPPSGGSPLSPALLRQRPRCPPASCLGSSPWGPDCPGRSSTRWCSQLRSSREAATQRPTAAGCGGGRSCRRAPPRMEPACRTSLLAAFGGSRLAGWVDTWHYCQPRFHQRLQLASAANPLYYVKVRTHLCDTSRLPVDGIKGNHLGWVKLICPHIHTYLLPFNSSSMFRGIPT